MLNDKRNKMKRQKLMHVASYMRLKQITIIVCVFLQNMCMCELQYCVFVCIYQNHRQCSRFYFVYSLCILFVVSITCIHICSTTCLVRQDIDQYQCDKDF